jgi:hypothetical protein
LGEGGPTLPCAAFLTSRITVFGYPRSEDWPYSSRRAYSSGADFHSLAMVSHERVLRHERGATNAPLRVLAFGSESANLRKNRRPPARAGRRSALRLLFREHGWFNSRMQHTL